MYFLHVIGKSIHAVCFKMRSMYVSLARCTHFGTVASLNHIIVLFHDGILNPLC